LEPGQKADVVKILKAELPWSLLAVAWLPDDQALAVREQLRQVMDLFPFASCVPFANSVPLAQAQERSRTGILLRAAAHEAPAGELLVRIETLLGLTGADVLRYADPRRGQRRAMRLARHGENAQLEAFVLAGDTSAQAWIRTLLQDELPTQAYGRLLLSPGARPPVAVQSRGKLVCTCFNVTDLEIAHCLADVEGEPTVRLAALQAGLKCGSNCGSCIPELKRLVRLAPAAVQA
jgi:assimilatory nitrate reductase catalytic subunit